MTWEQVSGRPEPVPGDVAEFDRARDGWQRAAANARDLRTSFSQLLSGTATSGFQGEAADAFTSIVRDTNVHLSYLAPVCDDIATVLQQHARRLAELREASRQALARATTAWNERARSEAEQRRAATRVGVLRRQLDHLRSLPPEYAGDRAEAAYWEMDRERRRETAATNDANAAGRTLSAEITRRDELSEQARSLDRSTAERLDGVDLRELKDPGWLDRTLRGVAEWVDRTVDNVRELGVALISGDFDAALWRLRDVCDLALEGLDALGPSLFALGWIPGVAGLGIAVSIVGAGLAGAKFGASAILAARGSVDRSTGERLGLGDVFVDGHAAQVRTALAVLSVIPFVAPATAYRSVEFAVTGVGLGNWDAPLPVDVEPGVHTIGDSIASFGPDGGIWGGTSASDPRDVVIRRDLDRIRSPRRGFASATNVCLVPASAGASGGW